MFKENSSKIIVFGITGGIAAFKTPELVKHLVSKNIVVNAVLTKSAQQFISVKDLKASGASNVYTDLFAKPVDREKILITRNVEHITVAKQADLFVIVPSTADIIAKLAMGIADDYVTTVALAVTCPIIVFPSMNTYMWTNPATQENVHTLKQRGVHVFTPGVGKLACGDEGKGRLPEVTEIVSSISSFLQKRNELSGKKIIVTFGGTKEYIDDVRFIANRSSGKMGAALADECFLRGGEVIALRSVDAVSPRFVQNEETFETAEELNMLCRKYCIKADIIIHAAAVSDFIVQKESGKIDSKTPLKMELNPRYKIITQLKQWNPSIIVAGFKAEWNISEDALIIKAKKIIRDLGIDLIIANDVGKPGQGFSSDNNSVVIVNKLGNTTKIPLASKIIIAEKIVNNIAQLLNC